MITAKLRKSGNSYIVTRPRDEMERLGLAEGQLVTVKVRPAEVRPVLAADLKETYRVELERGREALKYLAEN